MSTILTSLFCIQAAQSTPPASGDLNQYSWIIICALAGTVAAMGAFGGRVIGKLYKDLQKCQDGRLEFLEEHLSLLRTLHDEYGKPGQPGR